MIEYKLAVDSWDSAEISAIQEVINSRRFTMGPKVKEYEKRFAEYFGSEYAIMVNSGSSANLIALTALTLKNDSSLKPGDEVIVPAVSWSTTYYPVHQNRLKLKFVDINKSLNIDINCVEKAISSRTKAIFAVNLLGNPCELSKLKELCDKHNLYLLEDNCESMGSTVNGKYTGTFGEFGTFSTFFSHHLSTMEGGMILTDDKELNSICRSLRAHGWTRDLPDDFRPKIRKDKFYELYNFILPGYNVRPLEMSGAIGIEQLKKLDKIVEGRNKNAQLFIDLVKNIDNIGYQENNAGSSWFGFAIILNNRLAKKRKYIVDKLTENGIESRPIVAGNFTKNPVVEYMDHEISGELKYSDRVHKSGFFIGNNHTDLKKELTHFYNVLSNTIKEID